MKVKELRDRLNDLPDEAEVSVAIISKGETRRVLRRIDKCELKRGLMNGGVWISCYKSLRDEMDKLGGLGDLKFCR